jgi:hypothetical protein
VPIFANGPADAALDIGDEWYIDTVTTDDDGYATTATVVVTVTDPAGAVTTPPVVEDPAGFHRARPVVGAAGRWLAVAVASGGAVGAVPFTAWVETTTAAAGMPTVAQVQTYLGDTSYTVAEITDALTAEAAAQRARCRVTTYTDDLAQALKRRVSRNLAARSVPLATFTSFEGGGGAATRVPMLDAEIVRLEAPYRRLVVG